LIVGAASAKEAAEVGTVATARCKAATISDTGIVASTISCSGAGGAARDTLIDANGIPSAVTAEAVRSAHTGFACAATTSRGAGFETTRIVRRRGLYAIAVQATVLGTQIDAAIIPGVVTAEIIDATYAGFTCAFSTAGDTGGFAAGNAVFNGGAIGHDTSGDTVGDNICGQALAHRACIPSRAGVSVVTRASVLKDTDFAISCFGNTGGDGAARVLAGVARDFPLGIFNTIGAVADQVDITKVFICWAVRIFSAGGTNDLSRDTFSFHTGVSISTGVAVITKGIFKGDMIASNPVFTEIFRAFISVITVEGNATRTAPVCTAFTGCAGIAIITGPSTGRAFTTCHRLA